MKPEDYRPDVDELLADTDAAGARRFLFLAETFDSERLKTLSVWSMFGDDDLDERPAGERRGRTPREQMIHQFVSENGWFVRMLEIDVGAPPPPLEDDSRLHILERYDREAGARGNALAAKSDPWWEEEIPFFDVRHSRAWVVVRRIAHTAHHRGQLVALLRAWGRDLHSTYGPTADTGGLPIHDAPTIYAYPTTGSLLDGERRGGDKTPLPGPGPHPPTELGQP